MSELPKQWVVAQLGEINQFASGNIDPSSFLSERFELYSVPSFPSGKPEFPLGSEVGSTKQLVAPNDVLISKINPRINRVWQVGPTTQWRQIASSEWIAFRNASFDSRYFKHYFSSSEFRERLCADVTGVGGSLTRAQPKRVATFQIPIAPTSEQKRIADKLDTVLTRVDAVNTRLAHVAPLLKRFRQSVLAAATSGRLTEDWRDTNRCNPDQAQAELNAIRSKQIGKLKVRGEAARVDEEKLFPIPPSWAWTLNHQLAKDHANAICAGPFGTIFKAKDFRDSGVPIIFLRHVGEGRYLTHKPGFMDVNVWREHHQPYSVNGGELLVTKLGDPPGTACMFPNGIGAAMVTPDVLKMEVNEEAADTTYLMHFFNSPNSKQIIEELCFGVTRLRIDIAMFKTFPIPLPPRAEQIEIVRRVETLFAFADRLEARLAQAQTAATRLTPALLAKAFRGELVAQDPNDEPAAELLRRLAQAPAAASPRRGRKAAGAAV